MYTLYYSPGTCSMAVHVALNECKANFKLENVVHPSGQGRTAEYLKIMPSGQVPLLIDDNQTIREGAAILIHLLEKNHSPLLPTSEPARASALEWLMFANATLHPAYSRIFFLKKNAPQDATADVLMEAAVRFINSLWEDVEQRLSHSTYIAGEHVTIADILLTVIANWSPNVP